MAFSLFRTQLLVKLRFRRPRTLKSTQDEFWLIDSFARWRWSAACNLITHLYFLRKQSRFAGEMRTRIEKGLVGATKYHVSCEPLRIFWNDDTTCSTRVPCVLPITGWKYRNPARSRQHAWHSCRAGCIVISENPQGLETHMVLG